MRTYFVISKNPKAGLPDWHFESSIAFRSKANAENCKQGIIACLGRAGANTSERVWAIVEMDLDAEIAGGCSFKGFFIRLKRLFKPVLNITKGLTQQEFQEWQKSL